MYDCVFITHLPAFYKNNLYNEISKRIRILVIYISDSSSIRSPDFVSGSCNYDLEIINTLPFENRNKLLSCYKLAVFLNKIRYKKLVVGGWDLPEFWLATYLSNKNINCVVVESSIYESSVSGYKSWFKRLFLSRVRTTFVSGEPQTKLVKELQFKGKILECFGVGITNFPPKQVRIEERARESKFKYVYIGRLSEEKNLKFLFEYFASNRDKELLVIGDGHMRNELISLATNNIYLVGSVENEKLGSVLSDVDALILPSLSEAWGLVVEEALYYDLPVICSSKVGSSYDLVKKTNCGLLFDPLDIVDLSYNLNKFENEYSIYKYNAKELDIESRSMKQVQAFID